MAASTAKVPLPCRGTQWWLALPSMMASSCSQTLAVSWLKSRSQEPQSTSMAWRVRIDVVRGPGVSRIGALLIPLFLTSGGLKLRGLGCNWRCHQSNCLLLSEL
ncbi:hypothetical protein D3C78_500390 [compost metagenome]